MKGFSFIELIIIISLIGILAATSSPLLSSFVTRNNWHVASDRITSELRKAQSYAMEGKSVSGNKTWGVCLTGGVVRLFNGSCLSPNYAEDFSPPSNISVVGLSTVVFGNLRGEPDVATTVTVTSPVGSTVIQVNSAGMIGN